MDQCEPLDGNYARSCAVLAFTYVSARVNQLDQDFLSHGALDQAHEWARKAVQLDANLPLAHASLGFVLLFRREYDASIAAFERAVELNPNYVCWQFGGALVVAGNPKRAIKVLKAYMRLDPFHPPLGLLGLAHYMLKQYSQALQILRDSVCARRSCGWSGFGWRRPTRNWVGLRRPAERRRRFCKSNPPKRFRARRDGLLCLSLQRTTPITLAGCAKQASLSSSPQLATESVRTGDDRFGSRAVMRSTPSARLLYHPIADEVCAPEFF